MDHLQQAKFHLDRAIVAECGADVQALCGIGHALVALVELLQSHSTDAETPRIIDEAIMEQLRK